MNLSIWASRVLYDGHAGLGANLVGSSQDTSVEGPDAGSDEVVVAFEKDQPRLPFVIGSLWDAESEPPVHNAASRSTNSTGIVRAEKVKGVDR